MKIAATSSGSTRRLNSSFSICARASADACSGRTPYAPRYVFGYGVWKTPATSVPKSLPLDGFARRQRKGAKRAPVKAAVECDEFVAFRVIARELHGRFNGFGARVAKIDALRVLARRNRREFFRKLHHAFGNRNPYKTCESIRRLASGSLRRPRGWQWPVATTAIPAAKSRNVLPSTSSTIAPLPDFATSG